MRKVRYPVAALKDVPDDRVIIVPLGDDGGECALVKHNGRVYALGSLCPHQNAPLEGSAVSNGQIVCRRHGYCFHLKSGDCATIGGYGLPTYDVSIDSDTVFVGVWEDD